MQRRPRDGTVHWRENSTLLFHQYSQGSVVPPSDGRVKRRAAARVSLGHVGAARKKCRHCVRVPSRRRVMER